MHFLSEGETVQEISFETWNLSLSSGRAFLASNGQDLRAVRPNILKVQWVDLHAWLQNAMGGPAQEPSSWKPGTHLKDRTASGVWRPCKKADLHRSGLAESRAGAQDPSNDEAWSPHT